MFLPLVGAGLLVIGTMIFWSAIQNWLADFLARASEKLGAVAYAAQNALIVMDRIIVNGQRLYAATVNVIFVEQATQEQVRVEEVKTISREDLPADILAKLDAGERLEYTLSTGTTRSTPKHDPTTYRLVVRSSD